MNESKLVFPEEWIEHIQWLIDQDANWGRPDGYYGSVARICMEVYEHRFDGKCRFKSEWLDDIQNHLLRARANLNYEWGDPDGKTVITHQICRAVLKRARPHLFED